MNYSKSTKLDKQALKRDKFKCRECEKEEFLEVHHKIPNLEDLDNLITLCHGCHKKEHDMAGCFKNDHPYYDRWRHKWIRQSLEPINDPNKKRCYICKNIDLTDNLIFNRWAKTYHHKSCRTEYDRKRGHPHRERLKLKNNNRPGVAKVAKR